MSRQERQAQTSGAGTVQGRGQSCTLNDSQVRQLKRSCEGALLKMRRRDAPSPRVQVPRLKKRQDSVRNLGCRPSCRRPPLRRTPSAPMMATSLSPGCRKAQDAPLVHDPVPFGAQYLHCRAEGGSRGFVSGSGGGAGPIEERTLVQRVRAWPRARDDRARGRPLFTSRTRRDRSYEWRCETVDLDALALGADHLFRRRELRHRWHGAIGADEGEVGKVELVVRLVVQEIYRVGRRHFVLAVKGDGRTIRSQPAGLGCRERQDEVADKLDEQGA